MSNKSYIISVSMGVGCYRHIRITAYALLFDLHAAILDAFEFDDDHAHVFFMDNMMWSDESSYYSEFMDDEDRFTCDYKLDDAGLHIGKQFKYVFDFGDEWKFQCKVLKVLDEDTPKPQVVKSVGDAPEQYGEAYDNTEDDEDDEEEPSIYPEMYDDDKLKKLYAGLALPKETVQLLLQYFDAFANLYGIIPLRKALEIYNKQNDHITEADFAAFTEVVRHEQHYYDVLGEDDLYNDFDGSCGPMDREIIEESVLIGDDDYEEMKYEQEGKPYYIPSKRTLLKYSDESYFEQNAEYCALRDYLRYHMKLSKERADEVAVEMQLHAKMAQDDYEYILNDLIRMHVKFKDFEEVKSLFELYEALFDNTRMAFHRGHTPNEVYQKSGHLRETQFDPGVIKSVQHGGTVFDDMRESALKMGIPDASEKAGHMGETGGTAREEKTDGMNPVPLEDNVSRNILCPCGSGKKYKRCCGK